jgi:hypothetical protein
MAHVSLPDLQRIEKILSDDAVIAAGNLSMAEDIDKARLAVSEALNGIATPAVNQVAADTYVSDEIEIDSDAGTSPSDEGTWVQAWVWVPWPDCEDCDGIGRDEADQECSSCGGSGKGTIG